MSGEREKPGVIDRLFPIPGGHDHLHAVVQTRGRQTFKAIESMLVLPDRGDEVLPFDKMRILATGITQDIAERIDTPMSFGGEINLVGRKIHLSLNSGPCLETHHWFSAWPSP